MAEESAAVARTPHTQATLHDHLCPLGHTGNFRRLRWESLRPRWRGRGKRSNLVVSQARSCRRPFPWMAVDRPGSRARRLSFGLPRTAREARLRQSRMDPRLLPIAFPESFPGFSCCGPIRAPPSDGGSTPRQSGMMFEGSSPLPVAPTLAHRAEKKGASANVPASRERCPESLGVWQASSQPRLPRPR